MVSNASFIFVGGWFPVNRRASFTELSQALIDARFSRARPITYNHIELGYDDGFQKEQVKKFTAPFSRLLPFFI